VSSSMKDVRPKPTGGCGKTYHTSEMSCDGHIPPNLRVLFIVRLLYKDQLGTLTIYHIVPFRLLDGVLLVNYAMR
jgi:hypothetical protein